MTADGAVTAGSRPCSLSARNAASWVRNTPGIDTEADRSTASDGAPEVSVSSSTNSSSSIQPIGSNPAGRTTSSFWDSGARIWAASLTSSVSSGSSALSRLISSSAPSHAAPWPPKASAYGSPARKLSINGARLLGAE